MVGEGECSRLLCSCVCLVYPEVDEITPKREPAGTLCSISLQEAKEIEGPGDKGMAGGSVVLALTSSCNVCYGECN